LAHRCRILIIEDDDAQREAWLRSWLPADVHAVVATSVGKAIGIISRDRGSVYVCIVLDFDLQLRRAARPPNSTSADTTLYLRFRLA